MADVPLPGPGNVQARRPYPQWGVFLLQQWGGSSTYHSLQAKFEKRLSAGLWLLTSYTFSKSLWTTNTPAIGIAELTGAPKPPAPEPVRTKRVAAAAAVKPPTNSYLVETLANGKITVSKFPVNPE